MIPRHRLLIWMTIAFMALIIFGALLQVLRRLVWDLSYLLPSWLLGPVLLAAGCLFITAVAQFGWPWWKQLRKEKPHQEGFKQESTKIPKSRRQAAQESLNSIDRLLERLQDDVARQVLLKERNRVGQELNRGDLVVVVFGTGSSGKTSLIRALLNEIVGTVGAAMGSTTKSKVYRLRLKTFNRSIKLIDTPGILEAGGDGKTREIEARNQASRADLMVVVVDSDLRSSELEVIRCLSTLGKRLILVINKCDLRGEDEERRLVELLRNRCIGLVEPANIITTCASPQSIPRPGQRPFQPHPEVDQLLKRLAIVLHADGEELLAENILMQCRHLGDNGRRLLNKQRQKSARRYIDRYSWISGGVVAATPLPVLDLLGTAAVNAQMVMEIARVYGVQLTRERAQELALSVGRTLATLGVVKGGVSLIGITLNLSLPTLLVGRAIQGVAAAWLTRIAGSSFITYFQQNQDWGDGGIQEVVQRHYDLNRKEASLKKFIEIALQKVVQPLQNGKQKGLPPRPMPQEEEEASDHEHQGR